MDAFRRLRSVPKRVRTIAASLALVAASPFLATKAMHELGNRPLLAPHDSGLFGLLFALAVVAVGVFAVAAAVRAAEDEAGRDGGSGAGAGAFSATVSAEQQRTERP